MDTSELQYQLNRFEDWVKNADAKIGALIAFDGIFLVVVIRHSIHHIFDPYLSYFGIVGYSIAIFLLLWSLLKALLGIIPRLKHGQEKNPHYIFMTPKA